ncbi:alpha/beta hydrolase [Amycolatopsis sp. La24]|uniref:alpha/beta hydrolase n=1 Tax=Amycolatopsis sp. La24 TaxID=3028304 RepID=UPI0023AE9A66|nr:alpha/beta hydrolase [Amycolatopsis sp. La24]
MRLQNYPAPGLSLRSRAAMGLLGATWRPLTRLIPNGRAGTLVSRSLIAAGLRFGSRPVRGATFERVEEGAGPVVRGEWVRTPAADRSDGVVLYIHGSGYVVCSSRTHRGLTSQIAERTGLPVFSVDYRLAPSHAYPAASDDVRAAWDWLVAQGHDAAGIVVAGDSAGGHLALLLVLELVRARRPFPAALVALSPVVELDLARGMVRDWIERDPFAAAAVARRVLRRYADEEALRSDALRVAFDDLEHFPPALVHAGSREMLAADATELARRIEAAGFTVDHRIWPGLMHVFQAMTAVLPESEAGLAAIADFIETHLPRGSARPVPAEVATA